MFIQDSSILFCSHFSAKKNMTAFLCDGRVRSTDTSVRIERVFQMQHHQQRFKAARRWPLATWAIALVPALPDSWWIKSSQKMKSEDALGTWETRKILLFADDFKPLLGWICMNFLSQHFGLEMCGTIFFLDGDLRIEPHGFEQKLQCF